MVLANKQDLDGALSCEEVEKKWKEKVPHSNNQGEDFSLISSRFFIMYSFTLVKRWVSITPQSYNIAITYFTDYMIKIIFF